MNRIIGSLAALSLFACAGSGPVGPPTPLGVTVKRMVPGSTDLKTGRIKVALQIENTRAAPVTLSRVHYQVASVEAAVSIEASGSLDTKATLQPGQSANVDLPIDLAYPVADSDYAALLKMDTVPMLLTGTVEAADGTSTEFSRRGAVAPPNLPRFTVFDAQAATYEDQGIDVTFYLRLINENPFGVVVEAAEYTIELDGKPVADGTAGIGVRLPQGGVQEFEVVASVDEKNFGPTWKEKMSSEMLRYRMIGRLKVEGIEVPLSESGEIQLQ
jgi:LEA14-like dessication related protein